MIRVLIVTQPGFEPRQAESESAVLPLYYRAIKFVSKLKEKLKAIVLKFIQLKKWIYRCYSSMCSGLLIQNRLIILKTKFCF